MKGRATLYEINAIISQCVLFDLILTVCLHCSMESLQVTIELSSRRHKLSHCLINAWKDTVKSKTISRAWQLC